MKRSLLFILLLTLSAATHAEGWVNVIIEPKVAVILPEVQSYKTPTHLRSTGGDACAPLLVAGTANLYCVFGPNTVTSIEDGSSITASNPFLELENLYNID